MAKNKQDIPEKNVPSIKKISSEDIMYIMMTIVNDTDIFESC